ncbi:hypothetical protein KO528_10135 [Saccharophagus degradans]|uniref:LamG domain-containing protein n=1 Tax=Saccharophagus degradans TaxID=86304 RepID=UPI001C0809E1|nr:LamG domain-containing protein [Saccharophagus degradans]MBU2985709.1 hypothetical protein [Saccharophagus degradans]
MNNRISENTMKFRSVGLTLTKFVLLLLTCVTVYTHADSVTKGYVYSRGVVEEDDGTKYWAEYNPETGRLENHFPATDTYALDKTLLISGLQYRAYVNRWEDIKKTYKDAEILNGGTGEEHPPVNMATAKLLTEQFKILQPESADPNVPTPEPITFTFTVNDIETSVDAYDINDDVRHVILRPPVFKDTEQQGYQYFPILNNSGEIDVAAVKRHIILAQMPINPDEVIAENTLSLLVSSNTEEMNKRVVKESPHNIGLLTSFVNGVEGAEEYDGEDYLGIKYGIQRNNETEFTNPIQDAHISTYGGMGFEFHDLTDEDGKWGIVFAGWIGGPPCWIMTDMYSPIQIEMYSKSFNPRLRRGYPYYVQMPHYLPCNGNHPLTHLRAMSIATSGGLSGAMAGVNLIALAATSTTPIIRMDYIMDMKILAGQAELSNEHLSRDATQDIYSPIDRRSEVLDPATQAQWAASGWDKSISVSDSTPTEYRVDAVDDAEYKIVQQNFDLDGDGEKDTVKIGQFNCKTPAADGGQDQDRLVDRTEKCTDAEVLEFKVNEAATNESKIAIQTVKDAKNSTPPAPYYQAIYYSASAAEEGDDQQQALPDIVRLLDDAINDYHQGLLKVISEDDLRNTDIYVFRESSGDLLAERSGLAYRDLSAAEETTDTTNFDVDETNFHYRLQMRGGVEGASRISGRYGRTDANGNHLSNSAAFERWQNLSGMNPKFYEREADHIRPGEPVKIVAINRATGYIGTAKTVLDIKDSIYTVPSIRVPKIKMGPPNLKIWAERELKVEYGLTKDEDRNYLIGSEGGAETDDVVIKVYTEWLDQDGSALPEQLKDFGYTARLGKLTGENTIENYNVSLLEDGSATTAGQSVRYFPINPGKNLQLIRVSEANAGTQHLYVQVNGESYLRNPDFSGDPAINIEINNNDNRANNPVDFDSLGAGTDQLQYRPKHFVPILTPIWDENSTLENKLYFKQWEIAQEAAAAANNGTATDELNPFKPGAAYKWRYRPEYQFTVYDLGVNDISVVNIDSDGEETTESIITDNIPVVTSSDELIKFIYNLNDQVANPISMFSGEEKELVLAVGEEEFQLTFGASNTVSIDNIAHLGELETEDFLSIRIFTNNDASNAIWEWAFEYLALYTPNDNELNERGGEYFFISADEPEIELEAVLISYLARDGSSDPLPEVSIRWSAEGDADVQFDPQIVTNNNGVFRTKVSFSTLADRSAKITATYVEGDASAEFKEIVIVPGLPKQIQVEHTGIPYTRGAGKADVDVVVKDQHGNNVNGGTAIVFEVNGGAYVESSSERVDEDAKASAVIRGGDFVGSASLNIYAGAVKKTTNISIEPLTVEFFHLPEQAIGGQEFGVGVRAMAGATPAEGIPIDFDIDAGSIRLQSNITDENGEVLLGWTPPYELGVISIMACAQSSSCNEVHNVEITSSGALSPLPNTISDWLIGDRETNGAVTFTRYDDSELTSDYFGSLPIYLKGEANSTKHVSITQIGSPNRAPLLNWPMSRIYLGDLIDSQGRRANATFDVNINTDSADLPVASYSFKESSKIEVLADESLMPESVAFNLDVKPELVAGSIVQIGEALSISLDQTGRIVAIVNTVNSINEYTTTSIPAGSWSTLSVVIKQDQLLMYVDGIISVSEMLDGPLKYHDELAVGESLPFTFKSLVVGGGYRGLMRNFYLYNPSTPPLVVFADTGDESISVEFDDAGVARPIVSSNGLLDSGDSLNLTLSSEGEKLGVITLIGSAALKKLVAMQASVKAAPPSFELLYKLQQASLNNSDPTEIAEYFLSKTISTEDYSRFDSLTGALEALSYLPDSEQLIPHILNLQRFFYAQNSEYALYPAADSIVSAVRLALRGDDTELLRIKTALVVLGEVVEADSGVSSTIARSIKSKQDFDTWIRLLAMPARGWIGGAPPVPEVDSNCSEAVPEMDVGAGVKLPAIPCRLKGEDVVNFVNGVMDDSPIYAASPDLIMPTLKVFLDELPYGDLFFRRYAFSSGNINIASSNNYLFVEDAHAVVPAVAAVLLRLVLRSAQKMTVGAVKNITAFALGRTNSRISSIEAITAIAYLESRMADGNFCTSPGYCFDEDMQKSIRNLEFLFAINMAYKGSLTGESKKKEFSCKVWGGTQGKLFELVMVAYFHSMYEFMGREELKVESLQEQYFVDVFKTDGSQFSQFLRYYDIVLAGENPQLPTIVEVKSAQAHYARKDFDKKAFDARFPLWSVKKKSKTSIHRQLVLDHIATSSSRALVAPDRDYNDYIWVWHDWKSPLKKPKAELDPGVSIWRASYSGTTSAGEYLRDKFKELSSNDIKAKERIKYTINKSTPFKLPLDGTVSLGDIQMERFGKFNWQTAITTQVGGISLKEKLYEQLDPDTRGAIETAEELGETIKTAQEQLEQASQFLHEQAAKYIHIPNWFNKLRRAANRVEEEIENLDNAVDEYTLETLVPDSIQNYCE